MLTIYVEVYSIFSRNYNITQISQATSISESRT